MYMPDRIPQEVRRSTPNIDAINQSLEAVALKGLSIYLELKGSARLLDDVRKMGYEAPELNTQEVRDESEWKDYLLLKPYFSIPSERVKIRTTSGEFDMLKALYDARGEVVTREQLQATPGSRNMDMHAIRIRRKLGEYEGILETVHKTGHRLLSLQEFRASSASYHEQNPKPHTPTS